MGTRISDTKGMVEVTSNQSPERKVRSEIAAEAEPHVPNAVASLIAKLANKDALREIALLLRQNILQHVGPETVPDREVFIAFEIASQKAGLRETDETVAAFIKATRERFAKFPPPEKHK